MTTIEIVWVSTAIVGALNAGLFVVGYQIKSHGSWIRHMMGQNLMGLGFIVFLLMVMLAFAFFVDGLGPAPWIAGLVFLNLVMAQRNYMLFSKRWQSRAGDPGEDTIRMERKH